MAKTSARYSSEVRERAVRLVQHHQKDYPPEWAAMEPIASKIGRSPEALRKWVRRAELDTGHGAGTASDDLAHFPACSRIVTKVGHAGSSGRWPCRPGFKPLKRENRELRQATDILRRGSAFCIPTVCGWVHLQ